MVKQVSTVLHRPARPIPVWAAAAALLLALAAAWYLLPVGEWLVGLRGWIIGLGLWGVGVFALIYIAGAVVLAPEALLTVIAGFAYGFWGLPIVVVAATIGAALAFLIARYAARERMRRWLRRRRNLAAIDRAVAEDGWQIVALLRLSPAIPFNLQNYLFGVTSIPFAHFVAATFAGIIPGTALYIYIGVLGGESGEAGSVRWALFALGLAATVVVAVLVARKAGAKLAEAGIDEDRPDE
jgi:uncharacterized membrane protein YdjX (TVP38/TMEM64 family)